MHGLVATPYKSASVVANQGLVSLTKAIALEAATVAPTGSVVSMDAGWLAH